MSERTCGNCRWYDGDDVSGACRRHAPQPAINDGKEEYQYFADWPTAMPEESCGEWADGSITPEQEQKRELVRRFAMAIAATEWCSNPAEEVWRLAAMLADAEPGQ